MEEAGNITDNTGSKLRHKNVYKSKLQALGFNALSHGKVAAGKNNCLGDESKNTLYINIWPINAKLQARDFYIIFLTFSLK